MPISISKYVSIVSGIGGQSATARKDLILRYFTTNSLFPTGTVLEFAAAKDVANYAGSNSTEATIAAAYFGWISKQVNQAQKISFARYSLTPTAPFLRSTQALTALATLKGISDGSMVISMGGSSYTLTDVDFLNANAYADIATALQTAVRANNDGGELWTQATVTYDAINAGFVLTGGTTGTNAITAATTAASGTDISSLIGWSAGTLPIVSNGTAAMSLTDTLNQTIEISTNFATFSFSDTALSSADINEIGTWTDGQNMQYLFAYDVTASTYTTAAPVAAAHDGVSLQYNPTFGTSGLPAWLMPCTLAATTNYDKVNGTINYMYQQFPTQSVAVDTDALASVMDNLNINYNGQTQKSGTLLSFYQDGYNANGVDTAVFINEAWLKDAVQTAVINLDIALDKIPANTSGIALIQGILEPICTEAKNNGVISVGKDLTNDQKAYITQFTGDDQAWQTVYLNGYVLSINLTVEVDGTRQKYICEYALLYSKGDSIRKVEGKHILI